MYKIYIKGIEDVRRCYIPVLDKYVRGRRVLGKLKPVNLLPSFGFNGRYTTTVNGEGEPSLEDMLALKVRIFKETAISIHDEIQSAIS